MRMRVLLTVFSLFLLPIAAYAVRVPGLYEAEVPVTGQQSGSRQQAIEAAFKIVLIKLTGDRNTPSRPELQSLIRSAERYVQQYRYVEAARPPGVGPLATELQLRLKIGFDEPNLENALRQSGVLLWGRERPSTLVWIAIEQEQQRRMVMPGEDDPWLLAVNRRAEERGIALMHPLFDLQDSTALQPGDLRAGFGDVVTNASARYYPDTVLTCWLESPIPGIWEGHWTALVGADRQSWTTEGSFPETVLLEGVDRMADLLAERYARQTGSGTSDITLRVLDVNTSDQYARLLAYLKSLSAVSRVEVVEVNPGSIEFRLSAHGGVAAVRQAIGFGRMLEPVGMNNEMYRLLQ